MYAKQTYEQPSEYTINNVIHWEPFSKALVIAKKAGDKHANPLLTKAKKFLNEDCIDQLSMSTWICKPIKNYNKTSYFIRSTDEGFSCCCQGFNKKYQEYEAVKLDLKPICSHIIAVKQYCFIKSKNAS